jgi:hypothetical protein
MLHAQPIDPLVRQIDEEPAGGLSSRHPFGGGETGLAELVGPRSRRHLGRRHSIHRGRKAPPP